jgi:hypothetical protein
VIRKLLGLFACAASFGLVLDITSCGPTCAAGQTSCGTASSSGDAGANGDPHPTTCDQLTALHTCLDVYCKGADNPFCTCWKRGYDIDLLNCPSCKTFDSGEYCLEAKNNGIDAASLDCSAASDAVSSQCVGVQ